MAWKKVRAEKLPLKERPPEVCRTVGGKLTGDGIVIFRGARNHRILGIAGKVGIHVTIYTDSKNKVGFRLSEEAEAESIYVPIGGKKPQESIKFTLAPALRATEFAKKHPRLSKLDGLWDCFTYDKQGRQWRVTLHCLSSECPICRTKIPA